KWATVAGFESMTRNEAGEGPEPREVGKRVEECTRSETLRPTEWTPASRPAAPRPAEVPARGLLYEPAWAPTASSRSQRGPPIPPRTDHVSRRRSSSPPPTASGPPPRSGTASSRRSGIGSRSWRSEEHTSELQSRVDLVCRLLLEK